MDKLRVAVTGAAGQIGSVLIRRMLEVPQIDPVAICRNPISAGMIQYFAPDCEIRMGSITEIDSAKTLLRDCDAIINCALAMVRRNPKESRLLNEAMIDNFCHIEKVKNIIHMSSLSVYGSIIDKNKFPKNTFERPHPHSDYGESKLHIERYAKNKFLSKKLNYYILRLGHVYGARMDRSREIIGFAQNQNFNLPFNGDLTSNSIHVERLAAMIISLIFNPIPSGIYNTAEEQKTWRDIFDWHTQAIGMTSVEGMSKKHSEQLKGSICSASLMRDFVIWLRSLPLLSLIKYPTILDSLFRFLYIIPPYIANRLATKYKRLHVRRQISEISNRGNIKISPLYFSEAMPGEYLRIHPESIYNYPSTKELSNQLREWYFRFSQTRWLPETIRDCRPLN